MAEHLFLKPVISLDANHSVIEYTTWWPISDTNQQTTHAIQLAHQSSYRCPLRAGEERSTRTELNTDRGFWHALQLVQSSPPYCSYKLQKQSSRYLWFGQFGINPNNLTAKLALLSNILITLRNFELGTYLLPTLLLPHWFPFPSY